MISTLTPRERETLTLYAQGYSDPEIARTMGVTIKTVESHKHHLRIKMGFESWGKGSERNQLRRAAVEWFIEQEVTRRLASR